MDKKRKLEQSQSEEPEQQFYPDGYGGYYDAYGGYYDAQGVYYTAEQVMAYQQQQQQQHVFTAPTTFQNAADAFKPTASNMAAKLMGDPQPMQTDAVKKDKQASASSSSGYLQAPQKKKKAAPVIRAAGGQTWEDGTLNDWDKNDFRMFVGDLGKETRDSQLVEAFNKYPSFQKAKVIRDKSGYSKGYGFVSFKDEDDFRRAFREMNGKFIGSRPVKLKRSNWDERNCTQTLANKIKKHGYLTLLANATDHPNAKPSVKM